jgi:hypothetical protein
MGEPGPALIKALIKFHDVAPAITKGTDAQYGKFADLATILTTIRPAMKECGLTVTQAFEDGNLVTVLWHVSGERLQSTVELVTTGGRGNALHTWGGAVTYQRRYALLSILNLATEDDDADSQGNRMAGSSKVSNDDFL